MNLFKNSPFHPDPEKKMQELREQYRTSCPEIIRNRLKEDLYRAYEKSCNKEQSSLGRATDMQKIDKSYVTIQHFNLAKQELKSEITTVHVAMKNLTRAMDNLHMKVENAVELILQKMDENTAKMRVDIEEQRIHWNLAVDHYAPLHEKCEDHEVRIQKLEASDY